MQLNRRAFFKRGAKVLIGSLGAAGLSSLACRNGNPTSDDDNNGCSDCTGTCSTSCSGSCYKGCTGCAGACSSACETSCNGTCVGGGV